MELSEMIKGIREYCPEKAIDLLEKLDPLYDAIRDTRQELGKNIMRFTQFFELDKHNAIELQEQIYEGLLDYMNRIQEIQSALEGKNQQPTTLRFSQTRPEVVKELTRRMNERDEQSQSEQKNFLVPSEKSS